MLIGTLSSDPPINYKNRLLHEREKEYGEQEKNYMDLLNSEDINNELKQKYDRLYNVQQKVLDEYEVIKCEYEKLVEDKDQKEIIINNLERR